ncbi:Uma2 family endonuclease [Streptomyces sp. enrichment culture]|uniref:Uma2 family endonuclease n=1 Tax=Streptomyces sp. enrichment culture TaxID=1795815 RepID=UPI003F550EA8
MTTASKRDHGLDDDYEWPRPPDGGWISDDLDELPNLPRCTELLDASLVFASAQTAYHSLTVRLLEWALVEQAPEAYDVYRSFSLTLDRRNRLEPDVLVARAGADLGQKGTRLLPDDVLLVAEVVAEDSADRDRDAKPRKYAAAGIGHLWRIEEEDSLPVVHTYELDPVTRAYTATGIFRNRLRLTVPFPVGIDLSTLEPRR